MKIIKSMSRKEFAAAVVQWLNHRNPLPPKEIDALF